MYPGLLLRGFSDPMKHRGVFRTQSNIYDGDFCENSSVLDVPLGSKYASETILFD